MTLRDLLLAAACVCFAVALLVALGAAHSNQAAWLAGGLLAFALSHFDWPPPRPRP